MSKEKTFATLHLDADLVRAILAIGGQQKLRLLMKSETAEGQAYREAIREENLEAATDISLKYLTPDDVKEFARYFLEGDLSYHNYDS